MPDIEELRELSEKATEGEWEVVPAPSLKYTTAIEFRYLSGKPGTVALVNKHSASVGDSELERQNATAEFIVAAVNFVRGLLADPRKDGDAFAVLERINRVLSFGGSVEIGTDLACRISEVVHAGRRSLATEPAPIPMLLFCPQCGVRHVDEPDERTPDWTNPPHRSHLCHGCGCIWRPADVPTVGVASIETRGKADTIDLGSLATRPSAEGVGELRDDGAWHEITSVIGPILKQAFPNEHSITRLQVAQAIATEVEARSSKPLGDGVEALRKAVEIAAAIFREYERLHTVKGTRDGDQKALRNRQYAEEMEAALKGSHNG